MTSPTELAMLPATPGHIDRAKEAVRAHPGMQKYLDALLASNPTRGQMVEFTESVHIEAAKAQLEQRIDTICKAAGIDKPTGVERLMALQVGLLQDQNVILTRASNQARADATTDEPTDSFTALVGGLMLGAVLTR